MKLNSSCRILNLDPTFSLPGFTEIKHIKLKFPGGETHIKLDPVTCYEVSKVVVTHRITTGDNIMEIMLAKDALDRIGIKDVNLFIPYLPYARQDRVCDFGESLSLKVFANIINSLNFSKVTVLDAHSDVSLALINNIVNLNNYDYIVSIYKPMQEKPHLVFPDTGALKKYFKLVELFRDAKYPITCSKHRNINDGSLSNFNIDVMPIKGAPCLVIDDICDGGRTFIGIGRKLKEYGAGDLYLYTTHGIFSNGFDDLFSIYNNIYCTNSFKDITSNIYKIIQLKINLNVY